MRARATREGLWLSLRPGAWRLHGWRFLLPIVALPALLLVTTALAFHRESNYLRMLWNGVSHRDRRLVDDALHLYAASQRTALADALFLDRPPDDSQLPTVELYVGNNAIDGMFRAIETGDPKLGHDPGGDTPWFRALLREPGGDWCEGKVAYRGSFNWHHWPVKPSLRFKLKDDDVWNGFKYVELSRPKDLLALKHRLPELLAADLGLMTARTDVVRLTINRKNFGVYQRSRRPDESLALAHDRMPGTFFKGDAIREDAAKDLWASVKNWDTFGEATPTDLARFDELLALLRAPHDPATWGRFEQLFDLEVYAKWAAVMAFTGCFHTDRTHNHMYFLCSNQGRIEAMPWDPTCFEEAGEAFAPLDVALHPLMELALCDPRWVARRDEWIEHLLEHADLDALIDREVDRELPDLCADAQLSDLVQGQYRMPCSVLDIPEHRAALHAWAHAKLAFLREQLAQARCFVEPIVEGPWRSRVTVFGNVAVRAKQKDGQELIGPGDRGPTLVLPPGLSSVLEASRFDAGGRTLYLPHATPAPLSYELEAAPSELEFENAITGARVVPDREPPAAVAARSFHPWSFLKPPHDEVVLGPGDVVLDQDLHVAPTQTLKIVAGTRLLLAGGVGLYSSGLTRVEGTDAAPVLVRRRGTEPFAAFAISGAASAGTVLEHLDVEGGTSGSDGARRFKGMVDVYDCPDLVIRGCRFASNTRSDDTVNLAQSTFLVEDCLFEHANADSLDLDMSRGIVRRCLFRDGGNDGLDMMTCRVHAYDCRFERLGDKGFSIGEASRFLADDCVIDHCERGAAFKDGSTAVLRHVQAIGCNSGIDAYQKKATYGRAGHGLLIDCKVEQSAKFDFAIEKRGRVELLRTPRTHVDDHADQDIDRPVGMNTPAALAKKAAKKGAAAEKESDAEVAADPSATPALADRKVLADRKHAEAPAAPTAPKGTSADRVVMVERIAPEFAAVIRELEPEPRR